MYSKKYSALIIVYPDHSVRVKQYEDSTACKNAYDEAILAGYDAYAYFMPIKRKSEVYNPTPIEVIL